MLVLSVIQGPDKGRTFQLPDNEPQLIGRSSEALPIDDNAVSRRHAELTPDYGAWYIRDLQSQNGTYVNGVRITQRTRLKAGDQVRTGQTLMVFGVTDVREQDAVRILGPGRIEASIDRTLPSVGLSESGIFTPQQRSDPNEESVILAEPEPRMAAIDHLRIIYRLTSVLSERGGDRATLLNAVMDLVFSEFKPQRGCIVMLDRVSGEASPKPAQAKGTGSAGGTRLTPAVVRFREAPLDPDEAKVHISRTILTHCITRGEGVLSSNAMSDPRFAKGDSVQRLTIRSAVCSPIRFRDRTFGALYIDSSVAHFSFTIDQLALLNAIGQHAGLALANQELLQQKLQSERLAAMGETVATLSHSIKNILQGMRGGADVVEMGLTKGDLRLAKGGWPILRRNLDRIISLTMNMLAFSRQRKVELELVQLAPLLEDCSQLLGPVLHARQVALIVDVDPEVPPVPLDAPLIHQALMNLLTNAVEAVAPGTGAVTVRVQYLPKGAPVRTPAEVLPPGSVDPWAIPGPACVQVAVIDNGPGIPLSKAPWIFEPFHTTKGARGTGLGLAVARRVAEQHAGVITVESIEGKGSTFRLTLPVDASTGHDPGATTHSGR